MKSSFLGYGLALRAQHQQQILETKPPLDFLEFITEDFIDLESHAFHYLELIRQHYPLVMHGISLSIGSSDPLNMDYLKKVKNLAEQIEVLWISDHLCWTGIEGINLHDVLPLPYTKEMLDHVVDRVLQVQDFLNRPLILENLSTYLSFKQDEMSEWEFFSNLIKRTDCLFLLDVNNLYVNAFNHKFDPQIYLDKIPCESVQQIHLAGHKNCVTHIIDTHDAAIIDDVWNLYKTVLERFGQVPTLIERDDNIPALEILMEEVLKAKRIANEIFLAESV